jgi:hypothetical protein
LQTEPDLLKMIAALHAASRFAGRLHGGQQERDEHSDDGNDNEQFHQRKSALGHRKALLGNIKE